jgi:phosphotransferase system  glucose/maltose/N-acetylglucosamine-specific IIC component
MGVFVGIIAGFLGGIVYNKYYNFRKLPDVLSFFNGKRFVPLVVIFWSVVVSLVLSVVWPIVQLGINSFGMWIANSADTSPVLAPFVYGTLERLLLPFGLHHMLTIPMNYTSFGGTYIIQTGLSAGTEVFGQDPLWFAWITDLIGFKNAGNMEAYNNLLATVTPARFKVGQMIGSTGLGKTHLSTSIAKEVLKKGYTVVYESAQNIFDLFEEKKFGRDPDADTDRFLNADLLIMDDLGTEHITQFTVSVLYNLINERTNKCKATIISTNLSPDELKLTYKPRIFSRLFGDFKVMSFKGMDIRLQKLGE